MWRVATSTGHRKPVHVRRAYKFRAYLTRQQEGRAVRLLADHCNLYNGALEERREAWRMRKVSVSPLPTTGREVGVDVGVARFLTTSAGEIVANPRFLAASATVITNLQRRKARARPRSGNRKRLRRSLAKEWRKIRNRRRDFHHKTARALVDSCDPIALEDLNVAGMSRRPAPKPDHVQPGGYLPNGAAAKSGLNKSILDAGWAQFASILAAQAEEAGRHVILVNPAYTSIDCHACGARCTRPRQDTVICPRCGPHDADVNGAKNFYTRAGLGSGRARTA